MYGNGGEFVAIIKSLGDQVYDFVFHEIQIGRMSVGDKVDEAKLINELGISRTPIREALIQMTSDNILENIPRKGFFVKNVDDKEMKEGFDVVTLLDEYAIELAIPNITDDDIRRLSNAVDKMNLAISKLNYDMYYDWEREFHLVYRERCGNKVLADLIDDLTRKNFRTGIYDKNKKELADYLSFVNNDHIEVLKAIENKDVKTAQHWLHLHWTEH